MNHFKLYRSSKKEAGGLTSTLSIISKDIAMEFGISKHTHITMEAGKRISPSEIEL